MPLGHILETKAFFNLINYVKIIEKLYALLKLKDEEISLLKKQQQHTNNKDELVENIQNCPCTLFNKEDIFLDGSVSIFTTDINGNLANGS